jgi:hypothetical protein
MSVIADPAERQAVAARVRAALHRYQPRTYEIRVNEEAILKEEDWYHVLVTTPDHQRDRDFYDALARAEADLEHAAQGDVHYLLVPVLG